MLLTAGDRLVIIAALQLSAMHYGRDAEVAQKSGRPVDAVKFAAFAAENVRLVEAFQREK